MNTTSSSTAPTPYEFVAPPATPRPLTFRDCAHADPRLWDLEDAVRESSAGPGDPDFWCPDHWRRYSRWKTQLSLLVGYDAVTAELRSTECWDICHAHLLKIFERVSS